MEWLRRLLGDEKYNTLESTGALKILKECLGETEYIQNDPTKIMPKHVFNQKNDEVKILKEQVLEYQKQLKGISAMVTDDEMKAQLAKQELQFKNDMKAQETTYNKRIEETTKKYLITNLLSNEKAKHIDLLLNAINLDDVIVADNTIVNHEKILNPLKESYKELFEPSRVTGQTPPAGNTVPPADQKANLIKSYEEAGKNGNVLKQIQLMRQIKSIEGEQK